MATDDLIQQQKCRTFGRILIACYSDSAKGPHSAKGPQSAKGPVTSLH